MNIIYFVTHDTGRFLGCYGRPIPFSPNLDRFAAEGFRFDRAYCSAPCCGPSRNCAMTGKYSHVTGTLGLGSMGWPLPEAEQTIVDCLNDAGYETFHAGFCHERLYGEMRYQIDGVPGVDERYWKDDAENVVNLAIDYLMNRDPARSFYLNLATGETHTGHTGKERHGPPVPENEVWLPPLAPDFPGLRQYFAKWHASLRYLDFHFGRLLEAVDELGLRDNTLIVFTTDHGISHQRAKGHVYTGGVEISLLMRPPGGLNQGRAVPHLIPNIDLLPTLLDAAEAAVPDGLNGRSFWPLIAGRNYRPHHQIFIERNFHGEHPDRHAANYVDKYDPQRSVRTPEFCYIRHMRPDARPRPLYRHEITGCEEIPGRKMGEFLPVADQLRPADELYDTRHDPWEQDDLTNRPEYAGIKNELAARLDQWMRETDDPALKDQMPPPIEPEPCWPVRGRPVTILRQ